MNDPRDRFLACLWRGIALKHLAHERACGVGFWWLGSRGCGVGFWWLGCRGVGRCGVGFWWLGSRGCGVGFWWLGSRGCGVGFWWLGSRGVGFWWLGSRGVGFWWLGSRGVGFWWLGCGGVGRCCVGFRGLGWGFGFWVLGLVGGAWPGCCRRDIGLCRLGRGGGLGAGIGGLVPLNRAVSAARGEQSEDACDGSDPADCRGGHQPSIAVTACGLPTLTPFIGGRCTEGRLRRGWTRGRRGRRRPGLWRRSGSWPRSTPRTGWRR